MTKGHAILRQGLHVTSNAALHRARRHAHETFHRRNAGAFSLRKYDIAPTLCPSSQLLPLNVSAPTRIFVTREWPGHALADLATDFDVEVWPEYTRPPIEVLRDRAAQCSFIITTIEDPVDRSVLEAGKGSLKGVTQAGVGVDNVDRKAADEFGIPVTNAPGVLTDATADLAFALMVSAARRIVEGDAFVRAGKWSSWHPSLLLGKALKGATVGVIGLGRIGAAFAERCQGFHMRVLFTSRTEKPRAAAQGWIRADLDTVLQNADFVSLHTPLSDETRHLIGARELALMKPDAILINTARGGVVNTTDLINSLRSGRPGVAALDVTDPEPLPADHELLTLPNVVVTPHIGSSDHPSRVAMLDVAIRNLRAIEAGEQPPTPVAGV